jgi:hypothetical protein
MIEFAVTPLKDTPWGWVVPLVLMLVAYGPPLAYAVWLSRKGKLFWQQQPEPPQVDLELEELWDDSQEQWDRQRADRWRRLTETA